jgi:MFS transporter, ACS family, tartrate transporter
VLSGWLLRQNWWELPGWRWLFIIEGVPSVFAGLVTIAWLKERPRDATWLDPEEKSWLERQLFSESVPAAEEVSYRAGIWSGRLLLLGLIWFLDNMGVYGFNLWLPMLMQKLSGYSSSAVVAMSCAPFIGALAAAAYVSLSSDRYAERRWHTGLPMITFGAGLAISVLFSESLGLAIAGLCIAGLGLTSGTPGFWALATGSRATSGSTRVAIITSGGALGGFCGPYVMGHLREATNDFVVGMTVLSCSVLGAGILVLACLRQSAGVPRGAGAPCDEHDERTQEYNDYLSQLQGGQ